jgi:hypothetical protein
MIYSAEKEMESLNGSTCCHAFACVTLLSGAEQTSQLVKYNIRYQHNVSFVLIAR